MRKTIKSRFKPDYAVPPGETLKEWLQENGIKQSTLALRMGRPKKTINEIISGVSMITPETAIQLENVTGISASFWNNAESNFRGTLARLSEQNILLSGIEWAKLFPYNLLHKRGYVPQASSHEMKVKNLLLFFGIAGPKQWEDAYLTELKGAARGSAFDTNMYDLSAWLRIGEIKAAEISCKPYDEKNFKISLSKIRALTRKEISEQSNNLPILCREAGVAFVLEEELPKTHINGFTRWLTPTKALIQQSLRHKRDDYLWFTFFHEAAHILLHGKKESFLEYNGHDNEKEQEANEWATNYLIPLKDWVAFTKKYRGVFTPDTIKSFANEIDIAPSIVLGRLQREKYLPFNKFHWLFTQLTLSN